MERVKAVRDAFAAVLRDPAFREEVVRTGFDIDHEGELALAQSEVTWEKIYDATIQSIEILKKKGYDPYLYMVSTDSLIKAWDRYKDLSFAFETEAGSLDISNEEIELLDFHYGNPCAYDRVRWSEHKGI